MPDTLGLDELATALGARKNAHGYVCRCPAHKDTEPSLSLWAGSNGGIALKCFAGCSRDDVLMALAARGLHPELKVNGAKRPPPTEVQQVLSELTDLAGTPGEAYLAGRCPGLEGVPPSVKFRKNAWASPKGDKYHAVVGIFMRPDGERTAVMQVYVTDGGAKCPLTINKRIMGALRGGCIVLPGTAPVVLCEGLETGVSIWLATGYQVLVAGALTNFGNVELDPGSDVILAGDADKEGSQSDQTFRKKVSQLRREGHKPRLCRPERYDDLKKTDWNDVHVREGLEVLRARFVEILGEKPEDDEVFEGSKRHVLEEEGEGESDNGVKWLRDLNEKHAVLVDAGKVVVLNEEWDDILERQSKSFSSFTDFRNRYNNQSVMIRGNKGSPKFIPVGDFWLSHPTRRQYDRMSFAPGKEVPARVYNLWKGWAVEARAGSWALLQEHLKTNICLGNEEHWDYVLKWMAFGVQHPDLQGEVALVLRGRRGAGKGIFARSYGKLFGQHYMAISNSKHLVGNFNAHLRDVCVVFADEAFWAGDKQGESTLKTLITEPMIEIEHKGRDVVMCRNTVRMIIASNSDWVVPAGVDERRFAVFDVAGDMAQNTAYFEKISTEMKSGGFEAMLHDLQSLDLSSFDVRTAPVTTALLRQKLASLDPFERWWHSKLDAGELGLHHGNFGGWVANDFIYGDYCRVMTTLGLTRKMSEVEFWLRMKKFISGNRNDDKGQAKEIDLLWRRQKKTITVNYQGYPESKRAWGYTIPELSFCRRSFEEVLRQHVEWPVDDSGTVPEKLEKPDDDVPF